MSNAVKWLLWLIGLILLLWVSLGVESCRKADMNGWEALICNDCTPKPKETPPPPPVEEARLPIDFKANGAEAFTNPGYDEYRKRIIEGLQDGQILEITGHYYPGELAPEGFENMGFARAAAIRDLLQPDVPADRIILKSNLISESVPDQAFKGHEYAWIAEKVQEIEEIDGCTLIRFAFNSSNGQMNQTILDRLDKIAERVRATGEQISIIGHTDDVGKPEANLALGRSRARDIRAELAKRNVALSQMKLDSKGESEPVATNDSDRGRAENRRVEVCLIEN